MQKDDISILIVEDDQTLGSALKTGISRAGFKATLVAKPEDALALARMQPLHLALIDCMLPQMNGQTLAVKLKEEVGDDLPIALMSGIFRDKNFIREATQQTGAYTFLTKPFGLDDLLRSIEGKLESLIDASLNPLQALHGKPKISHKERIKAINEVAELHCFDLPWIFSLLMHPKVRGHLNIVTAEGDVCGVGFLNGNIVQVLQKDAKSYFGLLMVEHGFIDKDELEQVLAAAGKTKKIGERLVEANLLSPHAVRIVMAEQQGLRLSRIVSNTSVKVNFLESDEIREDASIDRIAFNGFLNDWLRSKLTLDWLKSTYMPWLGFSVKTTQEFSPDHPSLQMPVVRRVPDLVKTLTESETLGQALDSFPGPEEDIYFAMHALFVTQALYFSEQRASKEGYASHQKRLEKILAKLETQDHFERLNVSRKAKDSEIKRAYHDFAKILHPDKLGPDVPNEIQDLTRRAFEKISQAYEILSDDGRKKIYLMELEKGVAEAVLRAEQLAEQAQSLLTRGDFKKGKDLLETAVALAPPTIHVRLLLIWAQLKSKSTLKDPTLIDSIRDELSKVPPEDRHSPLFYFVRGLHLMAMDDKDNALKNFQNALALDSDFIDARRELHVLRIQKSPKPPDLLNGDLKDVVGLLFKKRK